MLVAASIRSSMVVLDEYLGRSGEANDLASLAAQHGVEHPLIDFAKAMVSYRAGDDIGTVNSVERAERNTPKGRFTIERLFGLANALRAGSKLNQPKKELVSRLKWIADRGREAAKQTRKESFGRIAELAFTAELAWLAHESGDDGTAVQEFGNVLEGLEKFPDQTFRLLRSLRLRVGHGVAWLARGARKTESLADPFPGLFANFEEPLEELLARPGAPYPMMWAALAEYAAAAGQTKDSRRFIRRASIQGDQQYYLAAVQAADASLLSNLIDGRSNSAIVAGIEMARLFALGGLLHGRDGDWLDPAQPSNLKNLFQQNENGVRARARETLAFTVLGPLFMGVCALEHPTRPDLNNWRRQLQQAFGPDSEIDRAVDLVRTGFSAAFREDAEDVRKIRHWGADSSDLDEHLQSLPLLMCCSLNTADLRDLLRYQSTVLCNQANRYTTCWTPLFCRMIVNRWKTISDAQPFRFRTPNLIRDATGRLTSRLFGPRDGARLLLTAAHAVGALWHPSVRETLEQLST